MAERTAGRNNDSGNLERTKNGEAEEERASYRNQQTNLAYGLGRLATCSMLFSIASFYHAVTLDRETILMFSLNTT